MGWVIHPATRNRWTTDGGKVRNERGSVGGCLGVGEGPKREKMVAAMA